MHLRQVGSGHDARRRDRPHRRKAAHARPVAAFLYRLLHLHEVVRADPAEIQLRNGDAAHALPGRRKNHPEHARLHRQAVEGNRHTDDGARLGREVRHRPLAPVHEGIGQGRGRPGEGFAIGQEPSLTHRRLLRRRVLHRADLHRLPRFARGDAILRRIAPRDRRAGAQQERPDHAGWRNARREIPAGGRRSAQLDQLPRLLEDVLRRGRGSRLEHLRQGRRGLR